MNIVFNIGLFFLSLYLFMDVLLVSQDGTPRPELQIVAGACLISMLIYNAYYLLSAYRITRHWPFIKAWMVFVSLMFIYYLISYLELPSALAVTSHRNIVIAVFGLAGIGFIYHGKVRGHLSERKLTFLILVLVLNGLLEIYLAFGSARIKSGVEVVNTSAGYVFLMITPMLMYKYRQQNAWLFVMALLLTAMTGKRGAIVIFGILSLYSFINLKTIRENIVLSNRTIIYLVVACVLGVYAIEYSYENILYRFVNIHDERTGMIASGRDVLWIRYLSYWWNGGANGLLIGHGFYSTIGLDRFIAHNDFIQFLFDFGFLGLSIYCVVLYVLYRNISSVGMYDIYLKYLLMLCFLILLGRGMTSGTIRADNINMSITLGYLLAMVTLRKLYNAKN